MTTNNAEWDLDPPPYSSLDDSSSHTSAPLHDTSLLPSFHQVLNPLNTTLQSSRETHRQLRERPGLLRERTISRDPSAAENARWQLPSRSASHQLGSPSTLPMNNPQPHSSASRAASPSRPSPSSSPSTVSHAKDARQGRNPNWHRLALHHSLGGAARLTTSYGTTEIFSGIGSGEREALGQRPGPRLSHNPQPSRPPIDEIEDLIADLLERGSQGATVIGSTVNAQVDTQDGTPPNHENESLGAAGRINSPENVGPDGTLTDNTENDNLTTSEEEIPNTSAENRGILRCLQIFCSWISKYQISLVLLTISIHMTAVIVLFADHKRRWWCEHRSGSVYLAGFGIGIAGGVVGWIVQAKLGGLHKLTLLLFGAIVSGLINVGIERILELCPRDSTTMNSFLDGSNEILDLKDGTFFNIPAIKARNS